MEGTPCHWNLSSLHIFFRSGDISEEVRSELALNLEPLVTSFCALVKDLEVLVCQNEETPKMGGGFLLVSL